MGPPTSDLAEQPVRPVAICRHSCLRPLVRQMHVETAFERWGSWKGLVYWFWEWSYLAGD
jgi:hypothetical protein